MSPEDLQPLIDAMNKYEELPRESWGEISKLFIVQELQKGDSLVCQGEKGYRTLSYILSGGVRHCQVRIDGSEQTLDFCVAGEFTGSTDFFLPGLRAAAETIRCFEETRLLSADLGELEHFLARNLRFMGLFGKVMLDYYRLKNRRSKDLLGTNASMRYERFLRHYPGLCERVPLYTIASFLDISPETLSRIRAKPF